MLTIITFFLVLSILVVIHELGHFIMAKKSGMLVEEFGLGLPPRIFGIKLGETLYSLNWLPFGGFVKIFGETPEDYKTSSLLNEKQEKEELLKRAFNNKPWYQRTAVLIAGPLMNFVLAVLVISYMFTRGVYMPSDKVTVIETAKGSPARMIGLKVHDVIVSFNNQKIKSSDSLIRASQKYAGQQVQLKYQRQGQVYTVQVKPRKNPPKDEGALGITISDLELKKYPWYQSPIVGLRESVKISGQFYQELGKILFKLVTLQKQDVVISGPIGIAKLSGQAAEKGLDAVFQLMGILSLNLALLNILPFPALDGGQLAFVLYEALTKKKINEAVKARINSAGFAILLFLLFLVTLKDIRALF